MQPKKNPSLAQKLSGAILEIAINAAFDVAGFVMDLAGRSIMVRELFRKPKRR